MKKYLGFFLCVNVMTNASFAYNYTSDTNLATFSYRDIVIDDGVNIYPSSGSDILVDFPPVYLYNNGNINGRIDTNNNNLFVYNTGNITGGITTVNGGNVVQMITKESEITNIDIFGGNYSVKIENYENVNFTSIKDLSSDLFIMTDSSIVVDNFSDWQNWNKNVKLEGPVCLIINNVNSVQSGDQINNIISGRGNLTVRIGNADVVLSNQNVINIINASDYDLIFNNPGLDEIRNKNPNDKLIRTLDSSLTQATIDNVKNNSYRFNHKILLRPVKAMNNFLLTDTLRKETDSGVGLDTSYMFSDSISSLGGRLYAAQKYKDLYFNLGFNFNRFSYEDELNDFSGFSYGIDIKAKQKFDKFFLYENFGAALTQFRADYITIDHNLVANPLGVSGFGEIDIGRDFSANTDLTLSPFTGIVYQRYDVGDVSDTDAALRGGGDIKYEFITDGIKYEYALSASLTTDFDFASSLKFGFWSLEDMVGASLNMAMFSDDIETYYKLSLNMNLIF